MFPDILSLINVKINNKLINFAINKPAIIYCSQDMLKTIGHLKPYEGYILCDEIDTRIAQKSFRTRGINYVSNDPQLHANITVFEGLKFFGDLFGFKGSLAAVISFFELDEILDKKVKSLTTNEQLSLSLARLMLFNTRLWLVDLTNTHTSDHLSQKIKGLFTSKINEGGLVIYCGKDMQIEHQISPEN